MDWLKDKLKCIGPITSAVVLALSLIAAVLAFDSRYIKPYDLQAMEQKVVKTLNDFQVQQDRRENLRNLETLNRQITTQKQIVKQNPNDPEMKEELQYLKDEKEKVKGELEKGTK